MQTIQKKENKEFERLFSEAQQLRKRLINTITSYETFDHFNKLIAANIIGKRKAEKNVKILNYYPYFFSITKETMRCYFLIELAKFFDINNNRNKTRTVYWLLDYSQKNIHRVTKKDFLTYHNERQIITELLENYKQLSTTDLKQLQKRLKNNESIIKKLKTYRDQYLAHDDIKKVTVKLTIREMKTLLNIVKDIIEIFYHKLDFSSNSYRNFEKEPAREIDLLLENLAEHEKQRIEKIKNKWN